MSFFFLESSSSNSSNIPPGQSGKDYRLRHCCVPSQPCPEAKRGCHWLMKLSLGMCHCCCCCCCSVRLGDPVPSKRKYINQQESFRRASGKWWWAREKVIICIQMKTCAFSPLRPPFTPFSDAFFCANYIRCKRKKKKEMRQPVTAAYRSGKGKLFILPFTL